MSTYLTHPLNKRTRPNPTDMFDNGRLAGHMETGNPYTVVEFARAYLTDQDFRHIVNKANMWSESA